MADRVGRVDEVANRGVLGEDGDPALFLEIVRVDGPFINLLVRADGVGLHEQGIDERRLP
jgi:hypothetical protein